MKAHSRQAVGFRKYGHKMKRTATILLAAAAIVFAAACQKTPEAVKLERLSDIKHWFTESAAEANCELGDEMVRLSLEYLEEKIK